MNIGIFIPVYHREKLVIECINSLLKTKSAKRDQLIFYVGINGAESSLRSYLNEVKKEFDIKGYRYVVYDPLINMGKPKMVNTLVKAYTKCSPSNKLDYIVSLDSDMVVLDQDWLIKILSFFQEFKEKPLGAICPNQKGNCCHVLDKDPIVYQAAGMTLITRAGNEGVAGGVLVTPYPIWDKLGGYEAHRIYASDDGHYALACSNNELIMGCLKEVSFFHPGEEDEGYINWKRKATSDKLIKKEEKGYVWTK